jgi:hypothetical protein
MATTTIKRLLTIAALALTIHPANAETTEEQCRKTMLQSFDELTQKTCPDLKRRGLSLQGECAQLLLPFIPTAKMPDLATYRMMWAEVRTEICVHFSDDKGTK